MGLLDMLTTQGTPFSAAPNGTTPPTNMGATQQSQLHADGNQPGYSLDGSDFTTVNAAYQQYVDGTPNTLPKPSVLDLDGKAPKPYSSTGPTEGRY